MKRRTVIVVSVLDVAAIAAALFFGLQSHATGAAHHLAVAQASPRQTPTAGLLEEEAEVREAQRGAAKASSLRAQRVQLLKRTAAAERRAQRLHAARARRASRAAEKRASASAPKRRSEREPASSTRSQPRAPSPQHRARGKSKGEATGNANREALKAYREHAHAEREAAREQRREQREASAAEAHRAS